MPDGPGYLIPDPMFSMYSDRELAKIMSEKAFPYYLEAAMSLDAFEEELAEFFFDQ